MNSRTEPNEKQDRQERYERRRSQEHIGALDDSPRRRRAAPYKRDRRSSYDNWEEEEWLDESD